MEERNRRHDKLVAARKCSNPARGSETRAAAIKMQIGTADEPAATGKALDALDYPTVSRARNRLLELVRRHKRLGLALSDIERLR